jgi:hypothetical protein
MTETTNKKYFAVSYDWVEGKEITPEIEAEIERARAWAKMDGEKVYPREVALERTRTGYYGCIMYQETLAGAMKIIHRVCGENVKLHLRPNGVTFVEPAEFAYTFAEIKEVDHRWTDDSELEDPE